MSDNLAGGRKIRLLNILEVFTKESLAMVVDTRIMSTKLSRFLKIIIPPYPGSARLPGEHSIA